MPVRISGPVRRAGVECLWRNRDSARGYSTAVSLHSHTVHSPESLDFIPRILERAPLVRSLVRTLESRHGSRDGPVQYERLSWRPPLHPHAAFDLEAAQIENTLGLRPLVSLTDHDVLEACTELRAIGVPVPYSLEWTVPYGPTVFHLGVHNLPAAQVRAVQAALSDFAARPEQPRLEELLAWLSAIPAVLLVMNHPFSNEERAPRHQHVPLLMHFLARCRGRLHALELNGLQPHKDNRAVMALASALSLPVVSGGDRHGREPNANVNLTNAASFDEFVEEIRRDHASRVLFLPHYREPLAVRYTECIWHVVETTPGLVGHTRWVDRVFHQADDGEVVPLARFWPSGGPWPIRWFISAVGFLADPRLRLTLRLALGRQAELGA